MTPPSLAGLLRAALGGFAVGLLVLLSTGALLAASGVGPPTPVLPR
ncbi:MAG TPA: hypothetical protein PLU22_15770 [Polyangiaceae bacterium]|nr:hypothetical protein [Polyangiaceae bacterium]